MNDKVGNPASVGLAGFGMTTILLNLSNAGITSLDSVILAMGIFVGGIAQAIAGKLEFQRGNTFGMTAFILYGSFWFSLVFIIILPDMGLSVLKANNISMGFYLLIWGIFSIFMTIGAFKGSTLLKIVFITLDILFLLLAISEFTKSSVLKTIAGYEGIVCGASALYLSLAELINEKYGRKVFPI